MMKKAANWMISVCKTDCFESRLSCAYGTEDDMKRYLLRLVKRDREQNRSGWRSGTIYLNSICGHHRDGSLTAYGSYDGYRVIYTARPLDAAVSSAPLIDHEGRAIFYVTVKADTGVIPALKEILPDNPNGSTFVEEVDLPDGNTVKIMFGSIDHNGQPRECLARAVLYDKDGETVCCSETRSGSYYEEMEDGSFCDMWELCGDAEVYRIKLV